MVSKWHVHLKVCCILKVIFESLYYVITQFVILANFCKKIITTIKTYFQVLDQTKGVILILFKPQNFIPSFFGGNENVD